MAIKEPKKMSAVEVLDILQHPENHKEITWSEYLCMLTEFAGEAASLQKLTQPQIDPVKLESRISRLERKIDSVADRLDLIGRAFGGGDC